VALSFFLRDVWALAIGFGSENAFRCLLSYILYPGLPSLGWENHAIRDLYRFSKQAFGLSFLNLIFSRTDIFVLGKLYSQPSPTSRRIRNVSPDDNAGARADKLAQGGESLRGRGPRLGRQPLRDHYLRRRKVLWLLRHRLRSGV